MLLFKATCLTFLYLSILKSCECEEHDLDFRSKTMGVAFSAYAKNKGEDGSIPNWKSYSLKDIKTMLEVISTRFQHVATYGVGADDVPYQEKKTYQDSAAQVMTAEAAALINKERNKLSLQVLVGIWQSQQPTQLNTEVKVALESIRKATSIYPDTVIGVVLTSSDSNRAQVANQTLNELKALRKNPSTSHIEVGSRQDCKFIREPNPQPQHDGASYELQKIYEEIIKTSTFIICQQNHIKRLTSLGPLKAYETVTRDFLGNRETIHKINKDIKVWGETEWPSEGDNDSEEDVENKIIFWELIRKWANETSFRMWMVEAFDNPWKDWNTEAGHSGWWKLSDNDMTGKHSGYLEKASNTTADVHVKLQLQEESKSNSAVLINCHFWEIVFIGVSSFIHCLLK